MLNPFRNYKHFTFRKVDGAIPKIDAHGAFNYDKDFIGMLMVVPDKLTLKLDKFELDVVHFGDHARCPGVGEL